MRQPATQAQHLRLHQTVKQLATTNLNLMSQLTLAQAPEFQVHQAVLVCSEG